MCVRVNKCELVYARRALHTAVVVRVHACTARAPCARARVLIVLFTPKYWMPAVTSLLARASFFACALLICVSADTVQTETCTGYVPSAHWTYVGGQVIIFGYDDLKCVPDGAGHRSIVAFGTELPVDRFVLHFSDGSGVEPYTVATADAFAAGDTNPCTIVLPSVPSASITYLLSISMVWPCR